MVQHKPTPEEQLLKLIETPDSKTPDADAKSAVAAAPKRVLPSAGKIFGFLDYFKAKFGKQDGQAPKNPLQINIKWLNQTLIAVVLASALYLALDIFYFKPAATSILKEVSVSDAVYPLRASAKVKEPKELSYYKDTADKRNPFMLPAAPVESAPEEVASGEPHSFVMAPPDSKISEVLQGLKLVGISWGAEPLAMIEDTGTGRTYFLRLGQEVSGIKVQEITKEKVVFTYEGEQGELF